MPPATPGVGEAGKRLLAAGGELPGEGVLVHWGSQPIGVAWDPSECRT